MIGKHHILILLSVLFLFSKNKRVLAQPINNQVQGVVMPPPDVAAMGKYVDIPVSYHTGVPSIGIPIHVIQDGPLSHPISLSYHASGVKLAEPASWVGLGWNLNGIGMVSRTVMGIPDDGDGGYFSGPDTLPTLADIYGIQQVGRGELDAEPDIFSFNFNGYSGKFFFDKRDTIHYVPQQDIKVLPIKNFGILVGFTILTPDGTRYTFGHDGSQTVTQDIIVSGTSDPSNGVGDHITSWYLLKIESFDRKHSISFHYTSEGYSYKYPSWCSAIIGASSPSCPSTPYVQYQCSPGGYQQTFVDGFRLDSITTSNQTTTVKFIADTLRTDLAPGDGTLGAKRLDEIQIQSGSYCKQINFSYDYWADSGSGLSDKPYAKRLKLNQVNVTNCTGGDVIPPYVFEYYAAPQGSSFMPHRLSKEVDHWGYYNKATVNNTLAKDLLIPTTTLSTLGGDIVIGGADRDSDAEAMKYGTLKKITYPTGGYAEFSFEANQVDDSLQNCVDTTLVSLSNCVGISCACASSGAKTTDFTFSTAQLDGATFSMLLESIYCGTEDSCASSNGYEYLEFTLTIFEVHIDINGQDSLVNVKQMEYNHEVEVKEDFEQMDPEDCYNEATGDLSELYDFEAGTTYRFRVNGFDGKATFTIYGQDCQSEYPRIVGGLRIKQIKLKDVIEDKEINRFFSYTRKEDASQSSGTLFVEPKYDFEVPNGVSTWEYYFSQPSIPLSDFQGTTVGYTYVRDSIAGNGQSEYLYKFNTIGAYSDDYPVPPNLPKFENGQLLKTEILDVSNNLVRKDSIVGILSNQSVSNAPAYKLFYHVLCTDSGGPVDITGYPVPYTLREGFYIPQKQINILDGVSTETNFIYDPNYRHLTPIATSFTNSNGDVTTQRMKYAHEMLDSLSGNDIWEVMIDSNRVGIPVEQITWVEDNQLNGTRTQFRFFNASTGASPTSTDNGTMPYPYLFEKYERTWNSSGTLQAGAWDTIGIIDSIDINNGFPISFTQRGWKRESLQWDSSNDLIKKRTFEDFTWQYSYYNGTGMVSSITDIDGQIVNYQYDQLMRLDTIKARGDSIVTAYNYAYYAGSGTQNSIETTISFQPVTGSDLTTRTTIQYLDGLGRGIQTVEKAYSDDGTPKDVIKAIEFDGQGRPFKVYETFESSNSNGNYIPLNLISGSDPHTLTLYEASPLNRALSVIDPNLFPTNTSYSSNSSAITFGGVSYPANSLMETTTTSLTTGRTRIYTDKKGRQIASIRLSLDGSKSDTTAYVYDDKDRVEIILPPGASLADAGLIYTYTYDERDNILTKKIPDQNAISYLYDIRNLMTYMQDGNMAAQTKWLHTQYDDYGRPTESGFVTSAPTGGGAKSNFAESLTKTFYDGYGLPNPVDQINLGKIAQQEVKILETTNDWLKTSFSYDLHGRILQQKGNNHLNLTNLQAEVIDFDYDYADNITQSIRIHKPNGTDSIIITERMIYDHSGRAIKNYHKVNNETEVLLSELEYTAKDQINTKKLGKVGASFLQQVDYTYMDNGFLKSINGATLGGSNIGLNACSTAMPDPGAAPSDVTQNDLFYLELEYNQPHSSLGLGYAQYNGNISQITWRVRGRERQTYGFKYDHQNRLIDSKYGDIADGTNTPTWNDRFNTSYAYDPRGNIDTLIRNGAYWDGTCFQFGDIDSLIYAYDTTGGGTNKLLSVLDETTGQGKSFGFDNQGKTGNYTYDANGNLTHDPYKGLTIYYNHLNLPYKVEKDSTSDKIEWLYDANGGKLQKKVTESTLAMDDQPIPSGTYQAGTIQSSGTIANGSSVEFVAGDEIILKPGFEAVLGSDFTARIAPSPASIETRDYVAGIEYLEDTLEAIYHTEGRVFYLAGQRRYEYNITDHLGNTRLSFTDKDGDGKIEIFDSLAINEILTEAHYYPFGMQMDGNWMRSGVGETRYKYNGKELNQDFGLDWYDYGARWYDASIGRWNAVDPLAEQYNPVSGYNYALNNPIVFIDPDGEKTIFYDSEGNEIHRSAEDGLDDAITIISEENINFFNTVLSYMKENNMLSNENMSLLDGSIEGLRSLGENYMIGGMKDLEKYGESLPLTTEDRILDPNTNEFLILKPEVSAKIKKEGNSFIVDMQTKGTLNKGTESPDYRDALMIHTHPNGGGIRGISSVTGRNLTIGGKDGSLPSGADFDNSDRRAKGKNVPFGYNIILSPTAITLFARGKPKIKVSKSFFKK